MSGRCCGGTRRACSRRSGASRPLPCPFTRRDWGRPPPCRVDGACPPALTTSAWPTRSVMIDCSRNGVLRVDSVKTLLRHMALMGSNMLQARLRTLSLSLCAERDADDERGAAGSSTARTRTRSRASLSSVRRARRPAARLSSDPLVQSTIGVLTVIESRQNAGYFRGPYTHDELREIDDYAFALWVAALVFPSCAAERVAHASSHPSPCRGIEVIACIQTLGHLCAVPLLLLLLSTRRTDPPGGRVAAARCSSGPSTASCATRPRSSSPSRARRTPSSRRSASLPPPLLPHSLLFLSLCLSLCRRRG